MKYVICLLLCGFWSISWGQSILKPANQWFFQQLVADVIPYDSISLSEDTGSAFAAQFTSSVIWSGVDSTRLQSATLTYHGPPSTTQYYVAAGFNPYVLVTIDPDPSVPDTVGKQVAISDANGRDSVHDFYWLDNSQLVRSNSHFMVYDGGQLTYMYHMSNPMDLTDTSSVLQFYRTQGRLDSVVQYLHDPGRQVMMKFVHHYSDSNKLQRMDVQAAAAGQMRLIGRYTFKKTASGQIYEVHEYVKQGDSLSFAHAIRYSQKSIGLPDLDAAEVGNMEMYPNPTSGVVNIPIEEPVGSFQIFDMKGQSVHKGRVTDTGSVEVHLLDPGVYMLVFQGADGSYTGGSRNCSVFIMLRTSVAQFEKTSKSCTFFKPLVMAYSKSEGTFITALGLMASLLLSAGTGFAQTLEGENRPLLNLSVGLKSRGYNVVAPGTENIHAYAFAIRPKLGYHVLEKLELGLSSEFLWQNGSDNSGYSKQQGYGLGYYARFNFYEWSPLNWISEEFPIKTFAYLEWEHLITNMYFTDETESGIGYLNAPDAHGFRPKGGLKVQLYKGLYANLGLMWSQSVSSRTASVGQLRPYFAIECYIGRR